MNHDWRADKTKYVVCICGVLAEPNGEHPVVNELGFPEQKKKTGVDVRQSHPLHITLPTVLTTWI